MIRGILDSKLSLTKLRWDVGRLQPAQIRALIAGLPTLRQLLITINLANGPSFVRHTPQEEVALTDPFLSAQDDLLPALASQTLHYVDVSFVLPRGSTSTGSRSTWRCVVQTKPTAVVELFKASSELREIAFHGLGSEGLKQFTGIDSGARDQ